MKWHLQSVRKLGQTLCPQGRLSRFADTLYLRREKWSFAFPSPCKQFRSGVIRRRLFEQRRLIDHLRQMHICLEKKGKNERFILSLGKLTLISQVRSCETGNIVLLSRENWKCLLYFPLTWCLSDICFFGLYGSTAEVLIAFLLNIQKNNRRLLIFRALSSHYTIIFFLDSFLLTFMDFFTHVRA